MKFTIGLPITKIEFLKETLKTKTEIWDIEDIELHDMTNNKVLATLRYDAKHNNGKTYNAQAAHLWTLEEGKITAFQQYVDTKKLADAYKK